MIDDDAELELEAEQIVAAAFGFQGQKCSACSRLIVHEKVYEKLLELVVARTSKIKCGPTKDLANWHGPVSEEGAYKKILEYVEDWEAGERPPRRWWRESRIAGLVHRADDHCRRGTDCAYHAGRNLRPGARCLQSEVV